MELAGLRSLVDRSRSGDLEAFGQIVRRFQDMAYGYAYSILGDFHLAEDAAQEAFIEAYRQLPSLRSPEAFPGWFRRIVFKHCDRITRRKGIETVPLDVVAGTATTDPGPALAAERRELQQKVLAAVRALPEHQRMVTTLFYINGYSQGDIADFLEVPVTTVKKRLHDSRRRLKERMMGMVKETLKDNAPDEGFSRSVIEELLGRPRPLEIQGHPVREILEAIRTALPDYEYIEGEEIVAKSDPAGVYGVYAPPDDVYHVDDGRVLRSETTVTVMRAIAGRTPPVRLFTTGRVFRRGREEDSTHLKAFHTLDVLCIAGGADPDMMRGTIRTALEAVLGPVGLKWNDADFPRFDRCLEAAVRRGEQWLPVAGCGMLAADPLKKAGYDPDSVSGFAFGVGLERLAMIKLGLEDIRDLWRPPYVP